MPACQWHPGERAGKHTAVSEAAGLFVIFSKVTRDCRRLTQWKILTEIMMEKDNKVKMNDSSENHVVKSIMSFLSIFHIKIELMV